MEELRNHYQKQIQVLQEQLAENNKLIREHLAQRPSPTVQRSTARTPEKNDQLLSKQTLLQEEFARLKS
jgi:histidinol-phosphate/aromatic aminotransferase/cobyric acid decarboxylase-like protein